MNAWLNQNGTNNKSLKYHRWEVPPNSIRGIFQIRREKIEKLIASMASKLYQESQENEEGKEIHPVHITTFALTCGYIWDCIAKAEQNPEASFVFTVDCRSRLKPAIPPSYIGNCVIGRFLNAKTEYLLGENGVAMAVKSISKVIARLREENGFYEDVKSSVSRLSNVRRSSRVIAAACSPRFEVYSTDFGWGNPRKVEMTSIDKTGAICLSESRNGDGGIEIGLVLNTTTMAAFASLFKQGLQAI